jgi:hypothetical protein
MSASFPTSIPPLSTTRTVGSGNPAADNNAQALEIVAIATEIGVTGSTDTATLRGKIAALGSFLLDVQFALADSGVAEYVPVPAAFTQFTTPLLYGLAGSVALYKVTAAQYVAQPETAAGTLLATLTLSQGGTATLATVAGAFAAGDFLRIVPTLTGRMGLQARAE